MTDHTGCCCTEALNDDLRALKAAYEAACRDRDEIQAHAHDLEVGCGDAIAACLAIAAAYGSLRYERDELNNALAAAVAERDRARDTAARLEAELARGFRITAPPATLTRPDQDRPATPNHPDNGDGIVQIRPGSGNTPPDTHGPERGPDTGGKAKHV